MGILSSEKATVTGGNLLDTLCAQLEKLMSFQPGERDLVMLQHKFVVEWADGKQASCPLGTILSYNLLIFRNRIPSRQPSSC
jgi:Saccharopine dehydrogenase C-terminal domain